MPEARSHIRHPGPYFRAAVARIERLTEVLAHAKTRLPIIFGCKYWCRSFFSMKSTVQCWVFAFTKIPIKMIYPSRSQIAPFYSVRRAICDRGHYISLNEKNSRPMGESFLVKWIGTRKLDFDGFPRRKYPV